MSKQKAPPTLLQRCAESYPNDAISALQMWLHEYKREHAVRAALAGSRGGQLLELCGHIQGIDAVEKHLGALLRIMRGEAASEDENQDND